MRQEYFLSSVIRLAQHSEATPLPASIRVSRQLFSGASTHLFVHRPRSLALTALPPTWAQLQFFISFISILSDLALVARSLYISSSFQCAQLRSLLGASPPPFVCPSYYLQLWCSRSPKPICAEGGCVANITATALSTPNTHTRIPRPPGADFQHSDVKWERIVGVDGQVMRACVSCV